MLLLEMLEMGLIELVDQLVQARRQAGMMVPTPSGGPPRTD
jgi:hypothetical protein